MVQKKQTTTSKKKVKKLKASDRTIRIGLVAAIVVFVLIIYRVSTIFAPKSYQIRINFQNILLRFSFLLNSRTV